MQTLTVSLVQGDTRWRDPAANRDYYARLCTSLAGRNSDLIVLPETLFTGFSNEAVDQAERMDGEGVHWMRDLAHRLDAVVCGSLLICDGQQVYNRLLWMRPDGQWVQYDKRHLFRMADEHEHFTAGANRLIVELKGWRILPQVCYDLRFPVWLRNRGNTETPGGMEYDLLVFVANWPAPRRQAWRTLLRARAIENLACCIGVNRTGCDGNGIDYAGDSVVLDAQGRALVECGMVPQIATVSLDPNILQAHRKRFPAWLDSDIFQLLD